jgi:hypothetical protein
MHPNNTKWVPMSFLIFTMLVILILPLLEFVDSYFLRVCIYTVDLNPKWSCVAMAIWHLAVEYCI